MKVFDPNRQGEYPQAAETTGRAIPMSPREAIAALLIAGARADGSVSPHEANVIEHDVAAMRLFRGCSQEAVQSIFTGVVARIDATGVDAVVRTAAAAIPAGLRATAFAMTIDLLYADGREFDGETRFALDVQALLGIDDLLAGKVVDVLGMKHAA
jgi:uncharacterized membrane protein YebE (DUF533 family)